MESSMSTQEQQLCQFLLELPGNYKYRYNDEAPRDLLINLFWTMAAGKPDYMSLFFPQGSTFRSGNLKLREAQGAVDGAEYTEAARGKPCGHIFRQGEATYGCRTCSADDTCCLCSKCFDATDHTGHNVRVSMSPGNSGCCDCGDAEAWKKPLFCTMHSVWEGEQNKSEAREEKALPEDLQASIRMTISRVFDYLCDVISCSPEQLRQAKTASSIMQDERMSRLSSTYCGGDVGPPDEWVVLLWNDEKHTVMDVRDQVARACKTTHAEGLARAYETDSFGRSLLMYDSDVNKLLQVAEVLERIRVTVTIRSSRDTFREQMCGTMVEWLRDIAGCSVGPDAHILRTTICEEMLKPWRQGSPGAHAIVGIEGMDDEDFLDRDDRDPYSFIMQQARLLRQTREAARQQRAEDDSDGREANVDVDDGRPSSGEADEEDDGEVAEEEDEGNHNGMPFLEDGDTAMPDWDGEDDPALETAEATAAGFPPPPPPPPGGMRRNTREREFTPSDSDTAEPLMAPSTYTKAHPQVPRTPGQVKDLVGKPKPRPGPYWVSTPDGYTEQKDIAVAENLFERVRLDWLILFDLRMWKKVRNELRSLYISTVVTIPQFKRVLGLRFAGLYTTLAQLYLIGDREPDHSIINISLQMLTTPSITAEIVERGNFLSNLMAILYTFLTTRQVGHPWDVGPNAVLDFDKGSVTNRRMYHFFMDLKYLFGSPHVQERLRTEERYMMQFLDLVKLHQGICPNVRAVGEHVEYETDGWISASLVTREINRLCRQFAEPFRKEADVRHVKVAIRLCAKWVLINSIGAERGRFVDGEIKEEVRFKRLADFEFEPPGSHFDVVRFVVEEQPISFHHALHYTLSWLVECAKAMSVEHLRSLLSFTPHELAMRPKSMGRKQMPRRDLGPEDLLVAAFDYPLRVCAWLAQMKAGMWVRNGLSLRHQAGTYRGVGQRDVSHHRDIFLLQVALVVCDPSRVLASVVDRFGTDKWVKGLFEQKSRAQDDGQHLDVVEDMIHLLIVLLSDRTSLMAGDEDQAMPSMRRDITHVLCFKPLSFNDICNKLPDRLQEHEDFHRTLHEMTTFKPPEGLSDVGTFELKPRHVEDVDPYIAHYNKNQREEAEMAWRTMMAKRTGRAVEDVVFEPKLRPITSGVFAGLARFTNTGMFAQVVYYCLLYALVSHRFTPTVPLTRVETFLHVVLHLMLVAVGEHAVHGDDEPDQPSFIRLALLQQGRSNFMPEAPQAKTIVSLLNMIAGRDEFTACHAKIGLILKRMRQKGPRYFDMAHEQLGLTVDRINMSSPASTQAEEEKKERKKKAALDRQAKVMAQFQAQQKSFMENQGDINWGDVDDEDDQVEAGLAPAGEHRNHWKYPSGTCILCQEDTDDRRLYGTFAFFSQSQMLRQTDFQDADFVREVCSTPDNLDRSAEHLRPFGVAGENRQAVEKVNAAGEVFVTERQVVGKGFPANLSRSGPVAVGCGHIMHYSCFETYFDATVRRHNQQIARHPPEDAKRQEFVCPLCKALGNAFLPIIWKGQEESYPGVLQPETPFASFLESQMHEAYYSLGAARPPDRVQFSFASYVSGAMINNLAERSSQLLHDAWIEPQAECPGPSSLPASRTETISTTSLQVMNLYHPSGSRVRPTPDNMMHELVAVYRRLRDTLRKNGLYGRHASKTAEHMHEHPNELHSSDVLARSLGYTMSAVEIQQRGVEAGNGVTFVEKMPAHVMTQLRILAETVRSYLAVGGLRQAGENRLDTEYRRDSERQHCQLFMAQYLGEETDSVQSPMHAYRPLLSEDTFVFLCECAFGVKAAQEIEMAHLVRLCYLAEIVKVVHHVARNMTAEAWVRWLANRPGAHEDATLHNFAAFCEAVSRLHVHSGVAGPWSSSPDSNQAFDQDCINSWTGLYGFVSKYALVFLRKTALLLSAGFGVDLASRVMPSSLDTCELDRLTETLRVPSLADMISSLTPAGPRRGWPAPDTARMVGGWIRHQAERTGDEFEHDPEGSRDGAETNAALPVSAALSHPAIFELIGLPAHYDTLIEQCSRRRCPTRGGDISDPIICLFCGDVFCGQAICCAREERQVARGGGQTVKIGGAQQHLRKCVLLPVGLLTDTKLTKHRCQRNIGLFINIRKCCVFYLHRMSGSFSHAPYIDRYGEVDMLLRHGRQLHLHQRRYDSTLRTLWLNHGIPSYISRKLEADINNGGWETI